MLGLLTKPSTYIDFDFMYLYNIDNEITHCIHIFLLHERKKYFRRALIGNFQGWVPTGWKIGIDGPIPYNFLYNSENWWVPRNPWNPSYEGPVLAFSSLAISLKKMFAWPMTPLARVDIWLVEGVTFLKVKLDQYLVETTFICFN